MTKHTNYQEQYYASPEIQREIDLWFDNKEALELNKELDTNRKLKKTTKSNREIIEDILLEKQDILLPLMPEEWLNNEILLQRYQKFCTIILENKSWWNKNKNKIELLSDGIFFPELGITLELHDQGLQDWDLYISNGKTLSLDQLRKIGDFFESITQEYIPDLISCFGFQSTAPYWSQTECEDTQGYAWYYNFGGQLYGSTEKKIIYHHTRYIK